MLFVVVVLVVVNDEFNHNKNGEPHTHTCDSGFSISFSMILCFVFFSAFLLVLLRCHQLRWRSTNMNVGKCQLIKIRANNILAELTFGVFSSLLSLSFRSIHFESIEFLFLCVHSGIDSTLLCACVSVWVFSYLIEWVLMYASQVTVQLRHTFKFDGNETNKFSFELVYTVECTNTNRDRYILIIQEKGKFLQQHKFIYSVTRFLLPRIRLNFRNENCFIKTRPIFWRWILRSTDKHVIYEQTNLCNIIFSIYLFFFLSVLHVEESIRKNNDKNYSFCVRKWIREAKKV